MTLYSDHDPFAAAWLRNLISAGHITPGEVTETSITDLAADTLNGYTRVHLFAGIGGWDHALSLAGWPIDRPVWTGSCPCQPFSSAGKRRGTADERHLWPHMLRLIAKCRPPTVFGEQVASPDGRAWLAGVRADLEALGYAVGAADLCAAGVAAPHIRQRLYWVADSGCVPELEPGCVLSPEPSRGSSREDARVGGELGGLGDSDDPRSQGRRERGYGPDQCAAGPAGLGSWDDYHVVWCRDPRGGPSIPRRVEPGVSPLVDGVPGRVGRLRGYGNAIVPQLAAEFVAAYIEAEEDLMPAAYGVDGERMKTEPANRGGEG